MSKRLIYLLLSLIVLINFSSCKQKQGETNYSDEFKIPDSVLTQGELEISEEAMEDIIENVSSPVEIAALIKSVGVPYSKEYLATTDYVDHYNTNFKQALGLGIFGADLGYQKYVQQNRFRC